MQTKRVKNSITYFFFVFLLLPTSVSANWYWITELNDPNTGYFIEEIAPNTIGYTPTETSDPYSNQTLVPDGFMDTMDETKASDKCAGELDDAIQRLRQFDAREDIIDPSVKCRGECSPYYANPQATMAAREQLLIDLENDARSCLVNEQREIEEAIEAQERKEAEEAREAAIREAVANCDLDFFNTMTTKEKMDTFREREACKTQTVVEEVEEVVESEPIEIAVDPEPTTQPVIPAQPVIQTPTVPVTPVAAPEPVTESEAEPAASTTESTSNPEESERTATDTPPEPENTIVESELEPLPSFFQRVIRFFTSWF